jgi:argininosuccinate lyase
MPSSFGLWFGAYAEILIDDLIFVQAALKVVDQNPLGSAAGYGSSFPINRSRTTELLGFSTLKYNVVAAQMSRGKMEKAVVMALSSLASTINKFATDACMFLSQNFDFIGLPKELTTGSSIMPHKQNPDVFELMRAKCNEVHGILVQLEMKTTNMSSGYFRDYQMLKEPFFKSVDLTHQNLDMLRHSLQSLVVKPSKVDEEKYRFLFSVEALNEKVKNGTSFRDAYREIGREILEGSFEPMRSIDHTHEGSIGNLNNHEIRAKKEELLRRPFSS